jgi:hypothetical protein
MDTQAGTNVLLLGIEDRSRGNTVTSWAYRHRRKRLQSLVRCQSNSIKAVATTLIAAPSVVPPALTCRPSLSTAVLLFHCRRTPASSPALDQTMDCPAPGGHSPRCARALPRQATGCRLSQGHLAGSGGYHRVCGIHLDVERPFTHRPRIGNAARNLHPSFGTRATQVIA